MCVFNGAVESLVGDKAITAKVGDTVRLFVGNGGPNLVSSFHVIGEIFDNVYPEGGTTAAQHNVQTTMIPAGGSAIVDFKVEVPGTYILVDHSLFRAFNKGALGMLKVSGPENLLAYSGKEVDAVYLGRQAPAGSAAEKEVATLQAQVKEAIKADTKIAGLTKDIQVAKGKQVFMQTCFVCHQVNGEGIPSQIPPLAKSDFLMADKERSIRIVLQGLSGEVTVNQKKFNGTMVPLNTLSDDEIANVLTYVRNSFGNGSDAVSADLVRRIRSEAPAATQATAQYTNEEQERVKARPMNWQISITALSLCLSVLVLEGKSAEPSTAGMVLVPAGRFAPLFRGERDPKDVPVKAFWLDVEPVTNRDFLEFVRSNPKWRRSQVKRLFADEDYLKLWAGDLEPGCLAAPECTGRSCLLVRRQGVLLMERKTASEHCGVGVCGGSESEPAGWKKRRRVHETTPSLVFVAVFRGAFPRWKRCGQLLRRKGSARFDLGMGFGFQHGHGDW